MNDCYCPCCVCLDRSSAVRPLKSTCLRMLMSIRTMQPLTSDLKICNVCRQHLANGKKKIRNLGRF